MSSNYKYCSIPLVLFVITAIVSLDLFAKVQCTEFNVGGQKGWITPKNDQHFDDWASSKRFKVNDTLRFEYKKDSVLVVTHGEYEKCRSTYPIFFSNNGNTTFTFDRPGLFYFISGVAGHCDRGLKMIVKVLGPEQYLVPPPSNQTAPAPKKSAGATLRAALPIEAAVSLVFAFYSVLF